MPELPEVEVVRRGLDSHVTGHYITSTQVLHDRPLRRFEPGRDAFINAVTGQQILSVKRRGKFLWFRLTEGSLLNHLGMSGQWRIDTHDTSHPHDRAYLALSNGQRLRYVDQRMFGFLHWSESDPPQEIDHIALDLFDPELDRAALARRLRTRRGGIKRCLLDQSIVSGIGNIYADEALWRAKLHPERPAANLTAAEARRVLDAATDVMADALAVGGTSFDSLYVNVNGSSGYFSRSLEVYGRAGESCSRCGGLIVREKFQNRSSHRCETCQAR